MNTRAVLDRILSELPNKAEDSPPRRPKCVVAFSGGADSTLLAMLAAEWARDGLAIGVLAHYAHRLRGDSEHSADLSHVRRQAKQWELPLIIEEAADGEIAEMARSERIGPEAAARTARYDFLRRACLATGAEVLLTGHNRDDQVETVAMRMLSGADELHLGGMPGIRRIGNVVVVRPLLDYSRDTIRREVTERGVPFLDDRSNNDVSFRRNAVRLEILPSLRRLWPSVDHDLLLLSRSVTRRRRESAIDPTAFWDESAHGVGCQAAHFFALDRDQRAQLLFDALARIGAIHGRSRPSFRFIRPVLDSTGADGVLVRSRGVTIEVRNGYFRVGTDVAPEGQNGYLRLLSGEMPLETPDGTRLCRVADRKRGAGADSTVLHLECRSGPIVVRFSRPGDRIVTACGTKRLARLVPGVPPAVVLVDSGGVAAAVCRDARGATRVERRYGARTDDTGQSVRIDLRGAE